MPWVGPCISGFNLQERHACPIKNTSLYHCTSLSTFYILLDVQFITSLKANLYTTENSTINSHAQTTTALHPKCIFKWNTSVTDHKCQMVWLSLCHHCQGQSCFCAPTAVRVSVGFVFSNKPVMWMWLSYSKPNTVSDNQRKITHWETLCFSPERYRKSPRRQQIVVRCLTEDQRRVQPICWKCSCRHKLIPQKFGKKGNKMELLRCEQLNENTKFSRFS
jgi:hypothetical protein